jgi:hypothetical protein
LSIQIKTFLIILCLAIPINAYSLGDTIEIDMLSKVFDQNNVPVNFNNTRSFACECVEKALNLKSGEYESNEEFKTRKKNIINSCQKKSRKWYYAKHKIPGLKYFKKKEKFAPYYLIIEDRIYAVSNETFTHKRYESIGFEYKVSYFDQNYFDKIELSYDSSDVYIYLSSSLPKARLLKTREKYLEFRILFFYSNEYYKKNQKCIDDHHIFVSSIILYDTIDKKTIASFERDFIHRKSHKVYSFNKYRMERSKKPIDYYTMNNMLNNKWRYRRKSDGRDQAFIKSLTDAPSSIISIFGNQK